VMLPLQWRTCRGQCSPPGLGQAILEATVPVERKSGTTDGHSLRSRQDQS
jgi:hypothetical protein